MRGRASWSTRSAAAHVWHRRSRAADSRSGPRPPGDACRRTDKTKLMFLCNPNNPTGTIYSKAEFDHSSPSAGHVLLVPTRRIRVRHLQRVPQRPGLLDGKRPIVVLRTFSRSTRWPERASDTVAPEPLVGAVDKVREPLTLSSCTGGRVLLARRRRGGRAAPQREPRTEAYLYSCFDRSHRTCRRKRTSSTC